MITTLLGSRTISGISTRMTYLPVALSCAVMTIGSIFRLMCSESAIVCLLRVGIVGILTLSGILKPKPRGSTLNAAISNADVTVRVPTVGSLHKALTPKRSTGSKLLYRERARSLTAIRFLPLTASLTAFLKPALSKRGCIFSTLSFVIVALAE